jgi:hypothetical protein
VMSSPFSFFVALTFSLLLTTVSKMSLPSALRTALDQRLAGCQRKRRPRRHSLSLPIQRGDEVHRR